MRQERIDVAEDAVALALRDDVAHAPRDGVHHLERLGIEVRRPGGELAQHDGREPGTGRGLFDDGALIQASSFCSAVPGPSAIARARAPTVRTMSRTTPR